MAETDKPADKPANKPTDAKPIVDVAHPGKSAPSGNSKSVIVSNRPLLKDPMVVADDSKTPDDNPSQNPPTKIKVKGPDKPDLQPLTAPLLETEAPDDATETTGQTVKPAKPAPLPKPEPEPEPKPGLKHEKVVKPPQDAAPADELAEDKPGVTEDGDGDTPKTDDAEKAAEGQTPAKGSTEQLDTEAAKQAEHQAAIEKLADSKQYYLPINTVEKRRTRRFVAIGIILSLLLIVAWADVALDAGLIRIHGLKPITHFFSN